MDVQDTLMRVSGGAMTIGGILAQKSTAESVGTAGIIIAAAGLVTAAYPWFKTIMDTIQASRKIAELKEDIVAAKSEADHKIVSAKRESDLIRAQDKVEYDRNLLNAQVEHEKRVSVLEERIGSYEESNRSTSDRRHLQMKDVLNNIEALKIRSDETTLAISDIIPAVKANAEAAGVAVPEVNPTFTKLP